MDAVEKALRKARDDHGIDLRKKAHVQEIGIGFKEVGGKVTDDVCLRVYVSQKVPASQLDPKDLVPTKIDGLPTDVNPKPQIQLISAVSTPYTISGVQPVPCGAQIAIAEAAGLRQFIGTATCYVRKDAGGGKEVDADYVLSCAHVLTPKLKDKSANPISMGGGNGIPVRQPAAWDVKEISGPGGRPGMAFLGDNPKVVLGGKVDAGTARMWDGIKGNMYVWKLGYLDKTPSGTGQATSSDANVAKYGRTTGKTYGKVIDFSYGDGIAYATGNVRLDDQYLVKGTAGAFCDEGDSGSPLVIPVAGSQATLVGMLIAKTADGGALRAGSRTCSRHLASLACAVRVRRNRLQGASARSARRIDALWQCD